MKKILALLLALSCIFALAACANNNNNTDGGSNIDADEALEAYASMLAHSVPTKSVTTSTVTESKNVLVSTATLTTGTIGGKAASTLVTTTETLNSVESGMLNLISAKPGTVWFYEGKGISESKGRAWDASGENFAPREGDLKLDLDEDNFSSVTYNEEAGELVLVCKADKAAKVISYYLPGEYEHNYETTITITAFGGRITGIKISYAVEERELGDDIDTSVFIELTTVEIDAVYSYGLETVDMITE